MSSENLSGNQQKVGQYYLLEKLAQGGMAEIYKGISYDPEGIKKNVCIKKILPHIAASIEFIDMLVNEAKIAVKLNHGNIAQIYDLGKAGDDYFIVMEYVEGQTLSKIHKRVVRKGERIPIPLVCHIILEIANGLNYMHRKNDEATGRPLNIVHRDISPQNIMITYSGTVKIIDFGIAKAAVKVGHTESGVLKGKFAYMSPEHAHGDAIDHRSDIFSLGVIFHELLTGERLFKASDNKQTLKNVRKAKVPPPSKFNLEIPKELDAIVLKSLAKERKNRYTFPSDLGEDLLKFLHTQYPDFRSSQLADYIRELFHDEIVLQQRLPAKTDPPPLPPKPTKTEAWEEQTKGSTEPVQWQEYLIEAEMDENSDESSEQTDHTSQPSEQTWWSKWSFPKQTWTIGISVTLMLVGIGAFLGWQYMASKHSISIIPLPPGNFPVKDLKNVQLLIESNPSGAKIYIDDVDTGVVTPTNLKPKDSNKKHTLGLYLEGYKFFKTEIETKENLSQNFFVELNIDYGALKIFSEPSEAILLINDVPAGTTPYENTSMLPGQTVKITLQHEGYLPHTQELKIEAGKEHVIHTNLEK